MNICTHGNTPQLTALPDYLDYLIAVSACDDGCAALFREEGRQRILCSQSADAVFSVFPCPLLVNLQMWHRGRRRPIVQGFIPERIWRGVCMESTARTFARGGRALTSASEWKAGACFCAGVFTLRTFRHQWQVLNRASQAPFPWWALSCSRAGC